MKKDKIRPIYDATASGTNDWIKANTLERTTAPSLADTAHALRWAYNNKNWCTKDMLRDIKDATGHKPSKNPTYSILKSDVSKAHRCCRIKRKDWKYQVAKIGEDLWINKVGTYGVASAQLYWGRAAALLVRILYSMFPMVEWFLIFVDDLIGIMREEQEELIGTAAMLTLYAIGTPMAWHKTYINEKNLWVGFDVRASIPSFSVTKEKMDIIGVVLT